MSHLSKNSENDYIIFDDENDKKYFDFNEAKDKLEKLMNNKNGKFTDVAIKLTIFSYYCIDIKIIDLPGINDSSKFFHHIYYFIS